MMKEKWFGRNKEKTMHSIQCTTTMSTAQTSLHLHVITVLAGDLRMAC